MLTAEGLAVFRGERLVFRDLSFSASAGEAMVLVGPNGSGKSTLLRLLAGLVRLEAGMIRWNGDDVLADITGHAGRVGYLGHLDAVKPNLTVTENLRFSARVLGGSVMEALDSVGLAALADLPSRMLSAGQKRRVALARLALGFRPLWLLDEPTLGLDTASVGRFGAMLAAHRQKGGIVIAATHVPLPLDGTRELRLA